MKKHITLPFCHYHVKRYAPFKLDGQQLCSKCWNVSRYAIGLHIDNSNKLTEDKAWQR